MAVITTPFHPRLSWGAILAGCALSLVTYLTLSVLGTAIGAGSIDPLHESNPVSGLGIGATIWLIASTLISVAVGAFIAGRTATIRGGLHGLLSWALMSLVTTWLVAALATSAAGAVTGVVGKGVSLAGQGIAAAAPSVAKGVKDELQQQGVQMDWNDLRGQLDTLLRQTGKPELNPDHLSAQTDAAAQDGKSTAAQAAQAPQAAGDELSAWFDRVRSAGKPAIDAADRDALVNIIAARTGKSHDEAQQIADNYVATYKQAMERYEELKRTAEQKAREAADVAARGIARAAWGTLLMLILGAAIAFAAGTLGRRSDPIVEA